MENNIRDLLNPLLENLICSSKEPKDKYFLLEAHINIIGELQESFKEEIKKVDTLYKIVDGKSDFKITTFYLVGIGWIALKISNTHLFNIKYTESYKTWNRWRK